MKQNKITLFIFLLTTISFSSNAQSYFRKYYGGTMDEEARHIAPTTDGNFIISGMTFSYGNGSGEAYLIKIDGAGNVLWSKTYGGADDDMAEWVEQTTDHGFAICGHTFSLANQDFRIFILKTDSTGNIQWQKQIKIADVARAYCIRETSDHGFIVSGEEDSTGVDGNLLLLKMDALGNLLWSTSYGITTNADVGQYVGETHDHGFVACGMSRFGLNSSYAVLLKTDSMGNQQWSKTYYDQIPTNSKIYPNKIQQLSDGSFIVSGSSFMIGSPLQGVLLMKTDSTGNINWSNVYATSHGEGCTDLLLNEKESAFYLCGHSQDSTTGNRNAMIMKTDSQGVFQWNNLYGNDTLDGSFDGIKLSTFGKFVLAGTGNTYGLGLEDIIIMNADSNGTSPTCALHQSTFTTFNRSLTDHGSLSSYSLTIAPINLNFSSSSGIQSIDMCQSTGITHAPHSSSIIISFSQDDKTLTVSNSRNEMIYSILICDVTGKTVFEKNVPTLDRRIDIPLEAISQGVYLVNVFSENSKLTRKFVVE